MAITPRSRPQMTRAELLSQLTAADIDVSGDRLLIVGVRGYYRDTMGEPGVNDRGIYDDAIFIDAPGLFASYNANVDPSRIRLGTGFGAGKGMASLKPGRYPAYKLGWHKFGRPTGHRALRQDAGKVTVIRDGRPPYADTGYFGINIHRGGVNGTSSEGCQTLPPSQWPSFLANVTDQVKRLGVTTIPYVLIDAP